MPSYDPSLFNVDPYYDDYSEDKKFLRLMFRPGYGVQARELTQVQTVLQNQIERFGSHVFDEGSIVLDGRINENRVSYAKVLFGGIATPDDFIGTVATVSGKARARVVHAEDPLPDSSDEYGVLFFQYLDGGTTFGIGDVITATAANGTGITAGITGPSIGGPVGDAVVVSVERGVRFVEGFFVLGSQQSIGAYSLTGASGSQVRLYQDPTTSIGFTVSKSFVTADGDDTLTDPAFGFYNYAAPGADRFKIDLLLSQRDFVPTDTSSVDNFSRVGFIEFMRIDGGEVLKVEKYPDYAMLEDTLARRTYDESGNYTVVPFELVLEGPTASGSSTVLKAQVGAGKGYVFGYEFETQSKTKLNIPCARTSAHERTVTRDFNRSVGTYVRVIPSGVADSMGATTDMGTHPSVILSSGESGSAYSPIGRARIRAISPQSGSIYNLYLYDIAMTGPSGPSGQFDDTRRIFMSGVTANGKHLFTVTGSAGLEGEGNSLLLYQVPEGSGVTAFKEVSYAVTTYTTRTSTALPYTFTVNAYTGLQFPFASDPAVSLPNSDITIIDEDGRVVGGTAARGANATEVSVTVSSNTSSGKRLHVMVTQDVSQNPMESKTKTLSTFSGSLTAQWGSALTGDGRGTTSDTLYLNGYTDVIEILSITGSKGASSGISILPYLSFDDGQRDSFYDWSRLFLSSGVTGITGPYSATFRYYAHGSENAPFTVKSYPDYEDIPSYTSRSSGTVYSLRDCIDFRPVRNTTGEIKTNSWIPTNTAANDNDFTYTHYLPRTDKIVITRDRRFSVLSGTPSLNGDIPPDDPNSMTLYTVRVNPYTFSSDDASIRYVENKRYTMRDIGDLEKRIEAVEYYTTLSLLEQEAKSRRILDEAGDEMPKRGILVDPFKGHAVADHTDPAFAAAIDYERNELRPSFSVRSYGLTSVSLSNTVGNGAEGIYTLSYSQSYEISHLLSSGSTPVNPFSVIGYLGTMSLYPSTDSWYDDSKQAKVRVNVEGENDNWEQSANYGFGTRYNDWEAIWFGRDNLNEKNSKPNLVRNRLLTAKTSGLSLSSINSSIAPETMKKTVRSKTVGRDVLPVARRRAITIKAKGLRPLTSVRVYCDDIDVTPYCTGSAATDGRGEAVIVFDFNAPKSGSFIEQRFLVGRHSIKVTDGTNIDSPSSWNMLAESVYMAEGAYDSVGEDGILSTRLPDTRRKSVQSDRIVSNLSDVLTSSGEIRGYSDPIAQTFYVDPSKYPNGIYVKSIDLYFAAKESLVTIPVTVQLRPTISGYPHPSKVLAFGSSTLYSDSVNVRSLITNGSSDATNFPFDVPVYLLPGAEYAICVATNSPDYALFVGKVGEPILTASEEDDEINVSKQPLSRALFKAGNTGNLVKNENEVLAFRLGVCKFSPSGTILFSNDSHSGSSSVNVNELRFNCTEIVPEGSSVGYSISMATSSPTIISQLTSNKNFVPANGNLALSSASAVAGFGTVTASLSSSSDGYSSPMIDLQRSSLIGVSNVVNDSTNTTRGSVSYNGELDGTNESASEAYRTKARYITKRVVLEPGVLADAITVSFSLCDFKRGAGVTPSVDVFVRPIPVGEEDYENVGYLKLSTSDSGYSTTDDEFREVSYTNIGYFDMPRFKAFSVKVVMYGDPNGSAIPRIRNMRIVAT